VRTAKPHRILDPAHGPLIAVRLNILTRKTLGGLETDLEARVLNEQGEAVPGLYAVGKQPALAAVACTATGRWKAPSWAAACSQGVMPGVPRRRPLFRGLWFRFAEQAPLLCVDGATALHVTDAVAGRSTVTADLVPSCFPGLPLVGIRFLFSRSSH